MGFTQENPWWVREQLLGLIKHYCMDFIQAGSNQIKDHILLLPLKSTPDYI